MDFDPVTGKLWDTENGPEFGDEINLVEPGFNSGWSKVYGIWHNKGENMVSQHLRYPKDLVDLDDQGNYSMPELAWAYPAGLTAIKIINSNELGEEYERLVCGGYSHGEISPIFNLTKTEQFLSFQEID